MLVAVAFVPDAVTVGITGHRKAGFTCSFSYVDISFKKSS